MAEQEGEPRGGVPSVVSLLPGVEEVPGAPGVEDPSIVGAEPPLASGGTDYPVQSTMGQAQSVQIQSGTEARSFWQPTDFRITNVDDDVISTASMGTIAGLYHRASAGCLLYTSDAADE